MTDASRHELRQAIQEMEVAAVCALARHLQTNLDKATIAAWVSEHGVENAIEQVSRIRPTVISRLFRLFGQR